MEVSFCRRCAAPVTKKAEGWYVCRGGHELFYKNSGVAVGMLLVNDNNQLLLATRAIEPDKGKLDAPGGFVELGESLEDAIARELNEELGLDRNDYTTPRYVLSGSNVYPYQGEVQHPYDVFFWARMRGEVTLHPRDDISEAEWFTLDTFNPDSLAFDTTRRALAVLKEILKPSRSR